MPAVFANPYAQNLGTYLRNKSLNLGLTIYKTYLSKLIYQDIRLGPKKIYVIAPIDRNGPKGTGTFMSFWERIMMIIPTNVPVTDAIKIVKRTPFHPNIAPIMARSLISPPPIPSTFLIR